MTASELPAPSPFLVDGLGRRARDLRVSLSQACTLRCTACASPCSGLFFTSAMYDNAFVYAQMGYASAMAWVQLLVTLILTAGMFLVSKNLVHYRAG